MAELHVSKKNISKLFSDMQGRKFVIPDYQRPYKWDIEKCETLWNDIVNFFHTDAKDGADYFLGTIVSYVNDDKFLEIIDGQQRITSFFLLLRAFYAKLEEMVPDDEVKGVMGQIAPCIWEVDELSQKVSDKSKIHIVSEVATEEDNETFHEILANGTANDKATDTYSVNYRFFTEKCDEYASKNPMQWKQLCITILRKCIVLPIECDKQETALTIFSTLNDRGLPLADSDIFKAQIYKKAATDSERRRFTKIWKELTTVCNDSHLTIDDLFRYYTHTIRARSGDRSKEVGLRSFYSSENYLRLHKEGLIDEIVALADFWNTINADNGWKKLDTDHQISKEAWKYLHCLYNYPNEYWKYPVSVYYLKNRGEKFADGFELLLKRMTAFLFASFVENPTVNAIKDDIYLMCIDIEQGVLPQLNFSINDDFRIRIATQASAKLSRALILLNAYQHPNQTNEITWWFEIEHILPQKWQNTNYNGWNEEDAKRHINMFGNKIVLEKKLNIQAGNGYFGKKKNKYRESKVAEVNELAEYPKDDWLQDDIEKRDKRFTDTIMSFFTKHLVTD